LAPIFDPCRPKSEAPHSVRLAHVVHGRVRTD
jgi:hypothetical protein